MEQRPTGNTVCIHTLTYIKGDGIDEVLVSVDSYFLVSQSYEDALEAAYTMVHQLHGRDCIRQLHIPQTLALSITIHTNNSWSIEHTS